MKEKPKFKKGDVLECTYNDIPTCDIGVVSMFVEVESIDKKQGIYNLRRYDLCGNGFSSWCEDIEDVERYYKKLH